MSQSLSARASKLVLCLAAMLIVSIASRAGAADSETRVFSARIDNKQAGRYTTTLSHQKDGSVLLEAKAEIAVRLYLLRYKYNLEDREVWHNGRLVRLESSTNDDGKQYKVTATATASGLSVVVNGYPHPTPSPADVWTTTYWHLPAQANRKQTMDLLDVDTGKDIKSGFRFVAMQQLNVAGKAQNCSLYTVQGGGLDVKLWYDAQDRLVREESVEDGHTLVLELRDIVP
ncbi:MAG TPA: DUF6134 family protein [Gemmataceae bacterium]|nr:DUF6134 family protein [Gemmataceae bacterium]